MIDLVDFKSTDEIQERRAARQRDTAEVFTPPKLVDQIINELPDSVWEEDKTFLDPACGNGNMLIQVLWHKVEAHGHDPLEALECIYGVDIMADNIKECQERMLDLVSRYEPIEQEHIDITNKNIVWLDLNIYPKGALDYDFSFGEDASHE